MVVKSPSQALAEVMASEADLVKVMAEAAAGRVMVEAGLVVESPVAAGVTAKAVESPVAAGVTAKAVAVELEETASAVAAACKA